MIRSALRAGGLGCALLSTTALTTPALAGQPTENDTPPIIQAVDENGVDQVSGRLNTSMTSISIGPGGPGSLTYNWGSSNSAQTELFGFIHPNSPTPGKYQVTVGGGTENFTLTGALGTGTFASDQGGGSTLSYSTATSNIPIRAGTARSLSSARTWSPAVPASPLPAHIEPHLSGRRDAHLCLQGDASGAGISLHLLLRPIGGHEPGITSSTTPMRQCRAGFIASRMSSCST